MRVTLKSGTQAEFARPANGEPTAGLVVIPDIMSLRPLFDDLCQRLADENQWAVCAPDLWPSYDDPSLEWRIEHGGELIDQRVLADVVDAADLTAQDSVGVIGFCMGGMYSFKAAGTGRFDRAAAFYGMIKVPEGWRSPTQSEPLDALRSAQCCPTLAIIGSADTWTPPDDIAELEALGVSTVIYDGAEHGFVHDPERPAYRPDAAADAWMRVTAFLKEGLTGKG